MQEILKQFGIGTNWLWMADFVDFLIIYFVIYRGLLLIKGTRAIQVVTGIILIVVLYFISKNEYWTLPTTYWFIEKFFANFVIVVIVVFQQDIRRALAQFGKRSNFFSGGRSYADTNMLEEVIQCATSLASKRIGALIAIERQADLQYLIPDEAVPIDAVVSRELLFSVFLTEHGNPLHDGAVIIRSGRIASAKVILPLKHNAKISNALGTRHRAGISLADDTDAAVVIVSEETGTMSVAYKEELFRPLETNELRDLLQRIFSTTQNEDTSWNILLEKFRTRRTFGRRD